MLLKLAWRNIWRNKRRTFITAASVAFAVFFATLMESIQRGAWDHMLNNVVNFYYGYAQVHGEGYWEDQSLDESLAWSPGLEKQLLSVAGVKGATARLESFALAASDQLTNGVLLVGTDPAAEDQLTALSKRIINGAYWSGESTYALVAEGVAERLELGLGDTIVVLSQGYHGVNAAGKYAIGGILSFGSPELNKRMVYLPLKRAETLFGAEGRATSVALRIEDKEELPAVMMALTAALDTSKYEVMGWQEMLPELLEARTLDAAGNQVVLFILYLIITFGIIGTILMMTRERSYEFGVLIGIGMHRWQLGMTVWLEIVFMGFLGTLTGMLLAFPLVYYLVLNPIDLSIMGEEAVEAYEKFGMEPILPAIIDPVIFGVQALLVLAITTLLALYPWMMIRKLEPIKAMREG
jgi:ABC-type lipoprotein release transport system permease subunit